MASPEADKSITQDQAFLPAGMLFFAYREYGLIIAEKQEIYT